MRDEYNIKDLNPRKNPYAEILNGEETVMVKKDIVNYFKNMEQVLGINYKELINLCLADIAQRNIKPEITWK